MDTIASVLAWLAEAPSAARYLAAANKLAALPAADLPRIKVAVLRNFTVEPIVPYIKVQCYQAGIRPEIYVGPYDAIQQEALDDRSGLYQFNPDIVVVAIRLHTFTPQLISSFAAMTADDIESAVASTVDRMNQIVSAIRSRSSASILAHGFERAPAPAYGFLDAQLAMGQNTTIARLNREMADLLGRIGSAYLIDIDHILASVGYDNGLDDRYWHMNRAPYAPPTLQRLASEYAIVARAIRGKNRKCLVLDCDNTLWGGVIGEDGMAGIKLGSAHPGSAYRDFQSAVLDLYHRGILLALNSKNNEDDAMQVFREHTSSLLRPEHFVAKRINWQDKATNLREIAAELNICLDSLVFVDDDPAECSHVRQELPQVHVIELPKDAPRYRRILQSLRLFDTPARSDEDRRRSAMYRKQAERTQLRQNAGSLDDYLRSLHMTLTIGKADVKTIPRIAQLTQKTNQFNVTTKRYTDEEIRKLADAADSDVFWARVADKFDDNGLVAVAILRYTPIGAEIDSLLMSCRVIGRGVEQGMIAHLAKVAKDKGMSRLIGEFIPTPKNEPSAGLFNRTGFTQDTEGGKWNLSLDGDLPAVPEWFENYEAKEC